MPERNGYEQQSCYEELSDGKLTDAGGDYKRKFKAAFLWCLRNLYYYTIDSCLSGCNPFAADDNILKDDGELPLVKLQDLSCNSEPTQSSSLIRNEKRIKDMLKRQFQNHLQKWKRRRFPYKILLHLLLVGLVTAQVLIFAENNSKLTRFLIRNEETFDHYFQRTDNADRLYTLQEVYKQITHIVDAYYDISEQGVGSFRYVEGNLHTKRAPTMTMKVLYYSLGCGKDESAMFPYKSNNLTWSTDLFPQTIEPDNLETCCDTRTTNSSCSMGNCACSIKDQIVCYINASNLNRINRIVFKFKLSTFFRDHIVEKNEATFHAQFDIQVALVNDLYSSMTVDVDLTSDLRRYCANGSIKIRNTAIDAAVMLLLILSSLTYITSVIRTYKLAKDVRLHFLAYYKKRLRWVEINPLFNKWYIFMLLTNVVLLVAGILKITFEYKESVSIPLVEAVRIILGVGVFFLWCGLFGVLSYFETLNVLFITIQLAFPSILRFTVCVLILFIAFVLCGWLVLGPYHPKFDDLTLSIESLYCILNGDDLYTTFEEAHLNNESQAIKLFSQLYLALFIFVFIYAVLSLFIGIFNQAYESLSDNWRDRSRGFLRDWAEGDPDKDPTKHYPFPVPPTRNLSSATEIDKTKYTPPLETVAENDAPVTEHPSYCCLHHSKAATNIINPHCSMSFLAKYQVAVPPDASKREVDEARFIIQEKDLKLVGAEDELRDV